MRPNDDPSGLGYRQELKRSLCLADLLAYGLVFIVPIAPIPLFGILFNASHGMVPLVYAVGLVAMVFTALSYMAMAREYPVAGSVYTYASQSLGPAVGFLGGWAMLLDYFLLPTVIYVACAIALQAAFPGISQPLSIVAMLAGATVINVLGIRSTARASFVLLTLQLLIIALFVVLSVRALMHHVAGAQLSVLPFYNPGELKWTLVFGALSFAVLSFLGFDAISTLSEEAKGGPRAIGRATMLSLCISAALFMGQTWLASLFLLGRTALPDGAATQAAFYDIAGVLGGAGFKFLLAVPGIVLSSLAGAVAAQAATARLLYGMARDGKLPGVLARVDLRRGVPLVATLLVGGLTLVLGLLLVGRLEFLTSMVSFGALVGFLLLHLSVIAHFIWRQASRRWLRHLLVPVVGLTITANVLLNIQPSAKLIGAVWLGIGLVLVLSRRLRVRAALSRLLSTRQRRTDVV
jgi:amino acid transporter